MVRQLRAYRRQARTPEVAKLLKRGFSNKEIGYMLHMSERTVKCHIYEIMQEIKVTNRTQAALVLNGIDICKLD